MFDVKEEKLFLKQLYNFSCICICIRPDDGLYSRNM
jgi:hypothetical protein